MFEQRRWRYAAVGVATVLAVGGCAAGASAQGRGGIATSPPGAVSGGTPDTVTVSGTGSVAGTPDKAVLNLTVHVGAPTANAALAGANAAMTRVQQALSGRHVAKADMQTSALSLQPNYRYDGSTPQLDGYVVDESLAATIRALSSAGTTVDAAVRAGGNAVRIDGFSLDLDGSALVARARAAAFADAKAKAEQYAQLSGRPLGGVVSVQEGQLAALPVPMYGAAQGRAAVPAMPVPVQPGTQQVSVDVQVVWALG